MVPPTGRAPHSSSISFAASAWPSMPCSGESCFSKRPEASVRRLSRVEVRWMFGPFQVAASISTRVVVSLTSERRPPITPAIEVGPSASSITSMSASSRRSTSSSVVIASPSLRAPHDELAARHEVGVERVHRLAAAQHHVVRDVDDVRDRSLAGGHQARLQPRRRLGQRDVLVQPRGEARAQLDVADLDREAGDVDTIPTHPGSSDHGGGASGARVAAWTSRASP